MKFLDIFLAWASIEDTKFGRKYLFGRMCVLLATLAFLLVGVVPSMGEYLAIFLSSIAGFYTIYCGGNISADWVSNKPKTQVILDRRNSTQATRPESDGPGPAGV